MSLRGATRAGPDAALIVFARAPVPGRVKTRLAPAAGRGGALHGCTRGWWRKRCERRRRRESATFICIARPEPGGGSSGACKSGSGSAFAPRVRAISGTACTRAAQPPSRRGADRERLPGPAPCGPARGAARAARGRRRRAQPGRRRRLSADRPAPRLAPAVRRRLLGQRAGSRADAAAACAPGLALDRAAHVVGRGPARRRGAPAPIRPAL